LHLDAVPVSGANIYKVKPGVLVSTVTPSTVVVFSALADEAEPETALGGALAGPLELEDELPHAATLRAAAITAAEASQTVRHGCLLGPEAARLCPHRAAGRRGPDPGMYCCLIAVLLLVFGSPATGQTPLPVSVHVRMCTSIPPAPQITRDLIGRVLPHDRVSGGRVASVTPPAVTLAVTLAITLACDRAQMEAA
jgi:hypothetical protein